jgi:hypothetical protein
MGRGGRERERENQGRERKEGRENERIGVYRTKGGREEGRGGGV